MGRLFLVASLVCLVAGANGVVSDERDDDCCEDVEERLKEGSGGGIKVVSGDDRKESSEGDVKEVSGEGGQEISEDDGNETPEDRAKEFYVGGGNNHKMSVSTLAYFINEGDNKERVIVFFDPKASVFSGESAAFADLTSAINGVVHDRLASNSPPNRLWAVAFGGVRDDAGSDLGYGGVIAGFDAPLTTTSRAGFFGGWSTSEMEAAGGAHDIETDFAFGGLYARSAFGTAFADVVITGGRNDNDSARRIFNPLAPGGQEFARGDYEGYFVNPELLIGYRQSLWGRSLTPTLSLGYAGLFLDDLNEKGSIAAISLEERDIHLLMSRAQVQIDPPSCHFSSI